MAWRDVLRASARGEFEQARALTDPEAVARALVVGRDALSKALEKVREKALSPPPAPGER